MYLTKIEVGDKDDYGIHKHLCSLFQNQKIQFARNGENVLVLSRTQVVTSENIDKILNEASIGKRYLFKIRLNPSCKKNGKKTSVSYCDIPQWIHSTFKKNGFACLESKLNYDKCVKIKQGDRKYSIVTVNVCGILEVKELDLFRSAIVNGIGMNKYLGYGMLNIYEYL